MRKKDRRIHNDTKKIKRAEHIIHDVWGYGDEFNDQTKRMINNLKICSCPMCGNPRKHFNKKTLKEEKNYIKYKEGVEEYENNKKII